MVPSGTPASSGLNKGNHFRLEFHPISHYKALLLLVSGKMSPKPEYSSSAKGFYLLNVEYPMRKFLPKYANFGLTSEGHGHNLLPQSVPVEQEWTRLDSIINIEPGLPTKDEVINIESGP